MDILNIYFTQKQCRSALMLASFIIVIAINSDSNVSPKSIQWRRVHLNLSKNTFKCIQLLELGKRFWRPFVNG